MQKKSRVLQHVYGLYGRPDVKPGDGQSQPCTIAFGRTHQQTDGFLEDLARKVGGGRGGWRAKRGNRASCCETRALTVKSTIENQ